ncbi:antibiotic biosynthesis monooxygenase [Amaricoccus sp.]|uniref:antibiotic biosynthesis monooxygenase n=1 Tax=Amaricoccus sp. TaxID=1872485 RepID=UPI0026230F3C|nr:antibiotic biosynthesis monooxygenase [Amaricoccus sp.]HRO12579.1 hypothetical protein [Amaricoccus sp.]
MSAYNIVRMRVKPGEVDGFLDIHRSRRFSDMPGMTALRVVRTGERDFCILGEWTGMDALAAARPAMIDILDSFRDKLEDLGGGLGVTDPVSGEAVIERHA